MRTVADHNTTTATRAQKKPSSAPFFSLTKEKDGGDAATAAPFFQPMLKVGAPNDKYEQEADAVADQVVQQMTEEKAGAQVQNRVEASSEPTVQRAVVAPTLSPLPISRIQRSVEAESEEQAEPEIEEPGLQRKPIFDSDGEGEVQRKCNNCEANEKEGHVHRYRDTAISGGIQRKCAACEAEGKIQPKAMPALQRSGDGGFTASSGFSGRLASSSGGGSPLPAETQESMGSAIGADFSGVRVHTGSEASGLSSEIGAQAFTHGSDVYFNEGKYDPGSSGGDRLLAHELTHVVQQEGGAYNISKQIIQRGEAGVHKGIEMEAKGLDVPKDDKLSPEQKDAFRIYVGNWMRDFSQAFVPGVVTGMAENVPQSLTNPKKGKSIGMDGAMQLLTGVLRALAVLEFGKEVADPVVNAANLGIYKPEEHIDNPMGMPAEDFVVTPKDSGGLVKKPEVIDDATSSAFKAAMEGTGVAGTQVENPELYKVSSTGLSGHIYNSIEKTKKRFMAASISGKTPQGMAEYGAGTHTVEDYFSHSNFIEVALNIEISSAMRSKRRGKEAALSSDFLDKLSRPSASGNYVDPLYKKTVGKGSNKRSAITTGTFGSEDSNVSLAHVVVPQLPKLADKINEAVDKVFGLVLKEDGETLWDKIKTESKEDRSIAAMWEVVGGMDAAGMTASAPVTETDERYIYLPTMTLPPYTRYDISFPTGFKMSDEQGIENAIKTTINSVKTLKRIQKQVERLREYFSILPAWVKDLVPNIQKMMKDIIDQQKKKIKHTVNTLLLQAIESMTGVDIPEKKRGSLHTAANYVKGEVEGKTTSTSLDSRLKNPDDPLTKLRDSSDPTKFNRMMVAAGEALPPSHSELSKDHPPHPAPAGAPGHKLDEGSPFYEVHKRLAVQSIKHLDALMAIAWDEKSLVGDKWKQQLSKAEMEAANEEAKKAGKREKNLQDKGELGIKRKLFQDDVDYYLKYFPDAKLMLDAVDLYISHPQDSNWWRPIVRTYVNGNVDKVLEDIASRNNTRKERTAGKTK